jgi:hypothetical protein
MTTQRAIVKGSITDNVQFRNMFVGNVTLSEGDTDETLWTGYLDSMYLYIKECCTQAFHLHTVELQTREGNVWQTVGEFNYAKDGIISGEAIANAVALVFIGKVLVHRGFGRKFFSGFGESMVVGNGIASAAVSNVATALAGYLGTYTGTHGGTLVPGLWTKDNAFHSFVGGFVSTVLGSMRRRKPGNGI